MAIDTSVTAISGPLLMVRIYSTQFCSSLTLRTQRVANGLNGAATAVDITITIALCTLLIMGRTGFEKCETFMPPFYRHWLILCYSSTDRMILRLIFISVNTGLWSAIFAFLSVILVGNTPDGDHDNTRVDLITASDISK
jgi:hypothetical protein